MIEALNKFFNQNKGVRRLQLLILFGLGIFATMQIFLNMTDVNNAIAACYSTLIVSVGALGAKYSGDRSKEK